MYFVTSMAGIVFKLAFIDHAIEYAVGFCTSNERDLPPVTSQVCWPASRRISADGHIAVQLTVCFLNNLTGTGRCNYIHTIYVAHQTAKRCFDSS